MRRLATLVLLGFVVACGDVMGPTNPLLPGEPDRLIQDALHNNGNPFFFWLAPMVAQPKAEHFGTADPAANPVVRVVCEAASSAANCPGGVIGSEVASFAMGSGVTFENDQYQFDFDTKLTYGGYDLLPSDTDQDAFTTYQVQVWVGEEPVLIGMASFQLGATGGDVRSLLQPDDVIGLRDGRVLPVKFRIDLFAHDYATTADDPCPNGCSVTRIDEEQGGTAYYHDDDTDIAVTGVLFEPGDLPPLPEGQDYTLVIAPLQTGDEPSGPEEGNERDLCAFDVDREKYDCFRYTLLPDETFTNPVRFGICKRTVPESDYARLVKVDRDEQDQAIVTFPDPVPVEDFLPCEFPTTVGSNSALNRFVRFALDRFVPPAFAQTTIRTWGGMANDFSDLFWSIDEGLISHWTADQIGYWDEATGTFVPSPAADALGRNPASWEENATPSYLGGISGDAFAFSRDGRIVRAGGEGWGTAPEFTAAAWVYMDPAGPAHSLQRLITATGPDGLRTYLHQDDAAQGERGVLSLVMDFPSLEESRTIRVPNVLAQGCWQHVAASYDGTTMRLYLNGAELGTEVVGAPLAQATNLWMSHDFVDGNGDAPASLYGRIDELRVYDLAVPDVSLLAGTAGCSLISAVDIAPAETQVVQGGTVQLVATALDATGVAIPGLTAQWSSSDPQIASVDAAGLVTGVTPATTTIHATIGESTGMATVTVEAAPQLTGTLLFQSEGALYTMDLANSDGGTAADLRVPATSSPMGGDLRTDGWLLWVETGFNPEPTGTLQVTPPPLIDAPAYTLLQNGLLNLAPAWSPDGTQAAFAGADHVLGPATFDVYTIPAGGGAPVALTTNGGDEFTNEGPAWSTSGDSLAYFTNRTESWEIVVLQLGPDTVEVGSLSLQGVPSDLSWIDGQSFLFAMDGELWVTRLTGSPEALTATQGAVTSPVLSQDGEWVAFAYEGAVHALPLPPFGPDGITPVLAPDWLSMTSGFVGAAPEAWIP